MKFFCCILSLYIISLLAFPCQDKPDCAINTEQSSNHSDGDHDCHTCSPFCLCNCCQVNAVVTVKAVIASVQTERPLFINIYKETPEKGISASVWQPPKA